MKRILVTLVFCCAAMCLFFATPALSKQAVSGQVSGLTEALKQLSPAELSEVLKNLGIAPAAVPKTGQTTSYAPGDDGDLQKGKSWPDPRFTDNENGTVTDNLTGLVWMKNASCFGYLNWADALSAAATVADGNYGLTDGSVPGDWRLPNLRELQSLLDYGKCYPALPPGHPFVDVSYYYWSSNTSLGADFALDVDFSFGAVVLNGKNARFDVWCVRGGQ